MPMVTILGVLNHNALCNSTFFFKLKYLFAKYSDFSLKRGTSFKKRTIDNQVNVIFIFLFNAIYC